MNSNPGGVLWMTLRDTGWYPANYKDEIIFVRRYDVQRSGAAPTGVIITATKHDTKLVRIHLERCAMLALKSYSGCECCPAKLCPAHAIVEDIQLWMKAPGDAQASGDKLRQWAVAQNKLTPELFAKGRYYFLAQELRRVGPNAKA